MILQSYWNIKHFWYPIKTKEFIIHQTSVLIFFHIFFGENTPFALSVGDADNIDRFDAYRIHEALNRDAFLQMGYEEKTEYLGKRLSRLRELRAMSFGTQTADALWKSRLDFYITFFQKLSDQLKQSKNVIADWPDRRGKTEWTKAVGEGNIAAHAIVAYLAEKEALLSEAGFLIYEHMNAAETTEAFFREYNHKNAEHIMTAPEGVG